MKKGNSDSGLYTLLIHLESKKDLQVGRLGWFHFPSGYYLYTGSARRHLSARLRRHRSSNKHPRWHIDYLLQAGKIVNIKIYPPCPGGECGLNLAISQKEGAAVVAKGFGSSDCNCPSHLYHFSSRPTSPGA